MVHWHCSSTILYVPKGVKVHISLVKVHISLQLALPHDQYEVLLAYSRKGYT
jgi:hypothetical protein